MGNGLRALNIASLNPDSMKERETQHGIVKRLTRNRIHLAAIQETHITRDCSYMLDNYRITTSSAGKRKETGIVTGGTAIAINESLHQNITQIRRQSIRALRVTLDHAKSKMPIHIISTCAPQNVHTEETKRQHWEDVQGLLKKHASNTSPYGAQTQTGN